MALRTDYKDDILDTSVNEKRVYNLIDQSGNVVMSGLSLEDVTVYSQVGDEFSSSAVNEAFNNINNRNLKTYTSLVQLGTNSNDITTWLGLLPSDSQLVYAISLGEKDILYNKGLIPISSSGTICVSNYNNRGNIMFITDSGKVYVGATSSMQVTKHIWRKVCAYFEFEGTLKAGETTITLTDDAITTDSKFDFLTSIYGASPVSAPIVTNGSITLEFDAQETDMNVEVRVM